MGRIFSIVSAIVISILIVAPAFSGSNPNGKPFIAINGQVVEVSGAISTLQDQIDSLVARVDTMEQRATACEDAVLTLQNQNAALNILVQQNLSDIEAIVGEIDSLQQTNTDLQASIAANSGDIEALQAKVDENTALIATLQSALGMVQNDLISLKTSIQSQIDNNKELIAVLQSEVDQLNANIQLKQDLINGTCPEGSAIQQILSDGSVVCESVGGSSGNLKTVLSYGSGNVGGYGTGYASASCPSGYMATSAGFSIPYYLSVLSSSTSGTTGNVSAHNNYYFDVGFICIVTCAGIAP